MLLNYLRMRVGSPYISDLRYTNMWKQVLICMVSDDDTCDMFTIYDWQEALLYLKGEDFKSNDYKDYLNKLIQ